jgi:hypothetical protein
MPTFYRSNEITIEERDHNYYNYTPEQRAHIQSLFINENKVIDYSENRLGVDVEEDRTPSRCCNLLPGKSSP